MVWLVFFYPQVVQQWHDRMRETTWQLFVHYGTPRLCIHYVLYFVIDPTYNTKYRNCTSNTMWHQKIRNLKAVSVLKFEIGWMIWSCSINSYWMAYSFIMINNWYWWGFRIILLGGLLYRGFCITINSWQMNKWSFYQCVMHTAWPSWHWFTRHHNFIKSRSWVLHLHFKQYYKQCPEIKETYLIKSLRSSMCMFSHKLLAK